MKKYKVKLQFRVEYETEVVVESSDITTAMSAALQKCNNAKTKFKEIHTTPLAIASITEIKQDAV